MAVYILQLQHGKYYVGYTRQNVAARYQQHVMGKGSQWTALHPPVKLLRTLRGGPFDEEKYTLMLMHAHGVDNVRGGSYARPVLGEAEREKAEQQVKAVLNLCYRCGKKGHVSAKCRQSVKQHLQKPRHCKQEIKRTPTLGRTLKETTSYNPAIPLVDCAHCGDTGKRKFLGRPPAPYIRSRPCQCARGVAIRKELTLAGLLFKTLLYKHEPTAGFVPMQLTDTHDDCGHCKDTGWAKGAPCAACPLGQEIRGAVHAREPPPPDMHRYITMQVLKQVCARCGFLQ